MARTLNQTVLAGGAVYTTGTSESDVKADIPDKFWGGGSAAGEPAGYSAKTVADLENEVEERNADREDDAIEVTGTGKDGKVLKKDLVAALEADDAGS